MHLQLHVASPTLSFTFSLPKTLGLSRLPTPSPFTVPALFLPPPRSPTPPRGSPPSRSRVCSSGDPGGAAREAIDKEAAELELLGKPSPLPVPDEEEAGEDASEAAEPLGLEAALAPFIRLFRARDSTEEDDKVEGESAGVREEEEEEEEETMDEPSKVAVEYYDPKPGDFVVGVVVSGNEHRLDVNVGADVMGTMLTKEVLPLYEGDKSTCLCDLGKDVEEFMVPGKIGIVKEEEAFSVETGTGTGGPVVEIGSVLFAEVLGRTLSGRPLLSTRRMFRRVAWHRVRQIKQLNEPIDVRITEWNTGGLLTRIEGLRAFLPKAELMNRVNNFTDLKENVGRCISACICKIDEANNDLIISEREAWDLLYLQEGTLLEGTVSKIFPFGAQVRIGETNRSGLLHISNITHARVGAVSDLLEVDEKVKVLIVKSMFPDKISLSIADLESEPGLFLSNKEKVFSEAEEMAKRYKRKLPSVSTSHKFRSIELDVLPFEDEASLISNWKWLKFEHDREKETPKHTDEAR